VPIFLHAKLQWLTKKILICEQNSILDLGMEPSQYIKSGAGSID